MGFFKYLVNCKFTGNLQGKFFLNRSRFDRIMVMSLWLRFFGPPCICLCLSADIKASDAQSSRNFHVACGRGSVLLWRRCDPLCTSGLRMTSCFHIMPDSDKDTNHLSMRRPGEEDHALPGWTTSRRGRDSPWKSQSE